MRAGRRFAGGFRGLLPALNAGFTFLMFFSPAIVGAAGSILFHSCALWSFVMVAARRFPLVLTRDVVAPSLAFWAIGLAYLASALVNRATPVQMIDLVWTGTLCLFPFVYATWSIASKRHVALALASGSALAGYAALMLAAIQHFGFDLRPEGGAGNPLVFAMAVTLAGLHALAGALYVRGRIRFVFAGAYVAALGAIGLSGSRAVWLAVAAGTAIALLAWKPRGGSLSRRSLLAGAAMALLAVALLSKPVFDRFALIPANLSAMVEQGNYGSELGERVAIWLIGLDLAAERPILGHGPGLSEEILQARLSSDFGLERGFTHFHNGYLTLFVEAGVVALVAFVFVLGWTAARAIMRLRRQPDDEQRLGATVLLTLVAVYAISGLTTIMGGHDILDTIFVTTLAAGTLLSTSSTSS